MSHFACCSAQCPGVRAGDKRRGSAVNFRTLVPFICFQLAILRVVLCLKICAFLSSNLKPINLVLNCGARSISGKTDCVGLIDRSYIGLQCGIFLRIFKDYFDCTWLSALSAYFRVSACKQGASSLQRGLEVEAVWFYLILVCDPLKQFCPSWKQSEKGAPVFTWY